MEVFKELIRDIVLVILLTTFLDMLLPSNKMRPYLKMVMGLFILVSILNPVLNLILRQQNIEVFASQQGSTIYEEKSIQQAGGKLAEVTRQEILRAYAQRIEVQMASLLKLIEGVEDVEVKVELKEGGQKTGAEDIDSIFVSIAQKKVEDAEKDSIKIKPIIIGKESQSDSSSVERRYEEKSDDEKSDKEKTIQHEVTKTLGQYFGVLPNQIKVVFPNGR